MILESVNFVHIFGSPISMDRWLHRNWQAPLISLDSLQLKFLVVINRMYQNLWKCPWWIWFINYTPSSKYFSSLGALQFFFLWKYLSHNHDMVSSLQAKIYHIQLQAANTVIGTVDQNIRLHTRSNWGHSQTVLSGMYRFLSNATQEYSWRHRYPCIYIYIYI